MNYSDYKKSGMTWPDWFRQAVRTAHEKAVEPARIEWEANEIADAHDDELFGNDEEGNHGSKANA